LGEKPDRRCLRAEEGLQTCAALSPYRRHLNFAAVRVDRDYRNHAAVRKVDVIQRTISVLRPRPLGDRKARLARLLTRALAGIVYNEYTDEDGATVFRHACKLGFEGIVSKRLTAPYRSGPSRDWFKVKNPNSPPMIQAREHFARVGQ
jgi:ATP-dependent DNA ligase